MILLAETGHQNSASTRDLAISTEAARLANWRVFEIPPNFSLCETAENALFHVPRQKSLTPTVWLGFIPDFDRYCAIYHAAKKKNLVLLNSPAQHQNAMEFDRFYPFLEDLTPRSVTVSSVEAALQTAPNIGFPIFVKGAIQGRKSRGWRACVAQNEAELRLRVGEILELENRSRGRAVLREVVALRHVRTHGDFPLGREFRVVLFEEIIVGLGYYWQGEDDLSKLNWEEKNAVENLAREAAGLLKIPYLAVDVGQLENGNWIVIEVGDAQFCGLSQIAPIELWHRLKMALEGRNG